MKIVNIFAEQLFAIDYGSGVDEFRRLTELWSDFNYLWNYAKENNVKDKVAFVNKIIADAERIEELLEEIENSDKTLEYYFRPLFNHETGFKVLSLQKGKTYQYDGLRIYAVKIDDNCFIITGGAIKMSQAMQDHPDTMIELNKINQFRDLLKGNGVFDKDSFFEIKNELE